MVIPMIQFRNIIVHEQLSKARAASCKTFLPVIVVVISGPGRLNRTYISKQSKGYISSSSCSAATILDVKLN